MGNYKSYSWLGQIQIAAGVVNQANFFSLEAGAKRYELKKLLWQYEIRDVTSDAPVPYEMNEYLMIALVLLIHPFGQGELSNPLSTDALGVGNWTEIVTGSSLYFIKPVNLDNINGVVFDKRLAFRFSQTNNDPVVAYRIRHSFYIEVKEIDIL